MSQQIRGRFEAQPDASHVRPRRLVRSAVVVAVLLLALARIGTEAIKLLTYADLLLGGGRMLVYGDVQKVDLGASIARNGLSIPILTEVPEEAPTEDYILKLNDGTTIVYQGHTYELNRNLTTVLLLGIDHTIQDETLPGNGGQSDVILLAGLDTVTGEANLLEISREANAEVDVYSISNRFIETRFEQITLAYAYGNGRETSCENTVRAVSRLLFGLPISAYLAIDLDGLMEANEVIGGVTVKSLIDVQLPDGTNVKEGDMVELHGKNLERYIRTRTEALDGNQKRMERQKQFLLEFTKQAVARAKENLTFPVELFSALSPYTVTNLDISDVTFISSVFLNHGAQFNLRTIQGTLEQYNESSIYYLDEVDLFEAVLQVFYNRID
ncbi:MAG: LCP family protein [Oscillospiraceae bacterium]|nr:LCP family protein [Oscillospiraceae bacterium]